MSIHRYHPSPPPLRAHGRYRKELGASEPKPPRKPRKKVKAEQTEEDSGAVENFKSMSVVGDSAATVTSVVASGVSAFDMGDQEDVEEEDWDA